MIVEELYDALIEAGASEDKARAASRAMADMQGHFAEIRKDISELRSEVSTLRTEFRSELAGLRSDVEGRLRLHDWMLGTILAFLVAIFFKVFSH